MTCCALRVVGLSRVPSWPSSAPPFERAVSMGPSRFLTHCLLRLATMPPVVLRRLLQRLLLVPESASPRSVSSSCKQSAVRLNSSLKFPYRVTPLSPSHQGFSASPPTYSSPLSSLRLVQSAPQPSRVAQPLCSPSHLSQRSSDSRLLSLRDASFPAWFGLMTSWPRSQLIPELVSPLTHPQ